MSLALHYWMGDVHHCSRPPSPTWPILCRVGSSTLLYSTTSKKHWCERVWKSVLFWLTINCSEYCMHNSCTVRPTHRSVFQPQKSEFQTMLNPGFLGWQVSGLFTFSGLGNPRSETVVLCPICCYIHCHYACFCCTVSSFSGVCYYCSEYGHMKAHCPHMKAHCPHRKTMPPKVTCNLHFFLLYCIWYVCAAILQNKKNNNN